MIFRKGKLKESIDNLIPMSSGRSYRVQVETNANLYQRYVNQCSQFNVPSLTFGFFQKRKQKVLLHSNIKVIQTAQYLKQKASLKQELDENTIMVILDFSQLNEDIYILFVRKNKRTTLLL